MKTDEQEDSIKRIEIGKRIARAIKLSDFNNTDIAKIMEVSPQSVQQWTNGKTSPKLVQLPKLAKILNVTVSYIILGEENFTAVRQNISASSESSEVTKYLNGLTAEQREEKITEIKDLFLNNIKIMNELN